MATYWSLYNSSTSKDAEGVAWNRRVLPGVTFCPIGVLGPAGEGDELELEDVGAVVFNVGFGANHESIFVRVGLGFGQAPSPLNDTSSPNTSESAKPICILLRTNSVPAPKVGTTPKVPSAAMTNHIQPEDAIPVAAAAKSDLSCERDPSCSRIWFASRAEIPSSCVVSSGPRGFFGDNTKVWVRVPFY